MMPALLEGLNRTSGLAARPYPLLLENGKPQPLGMAAEGRSTDDQNVSTGFTLSGSS